MIKELKLNPIKIRKLVDDSKVDIVPDDNQ